MKIIKFLNQKHVCISESRCYLKMTREKSMEILNEFLVEFIFAIPSMENY